MYVTWQLLAVPFIGTRTQERLLNVPSFGVAFHNTFQVGALATPGLVSRTVAVNVADAP